MYTNFIVLAISFFLGMTARNWYDKYKDKKKNKNKP